MLEHKVIDFRGEMICPYWIICDRRDDFNCPHKILHKKKSSCCLPCHFYPEVRLKEGDTTCFSIGEVNESNM